uniref:Uncharacterized protein n=1 Tax=Ditylenchus dipsaci TaxID=166011 RepID=A0A915DMU4_9BILA
MYVALSDSVSSSEIIATTEVSSTSDSPDFEAVASTVIFANHQIFLLFFAVLCLFLCSLFANFVLWTRNVALKREVRKHYGEPRPPKLCFKGNRIAAAASGSKNTTRY